MTGERGASLCYDLPYGRVIFVYYFKFLFKKVVRRAHKRLA